MANTLNASPTDDITLKESAEEIGLFFEKNNLTPMEARVFALLLLADPPELDFTTIRKFLKASKSTISNSLKRLIDDGRVDYKTKPGDRKRYFKVSPGKWLQRLKVRFVAVALFAAAMHEINQMRRQRTAAILTNN